MYTKKICRTYVLLDEQSKKAVYSLITEFDLEEWKFYGEHMTVVYGRQYNTLNLDYQLGDEVQLTGTHLGKSENCVALKVNGFYSFNEIPHVTLLVNQTNNSTPVMSNKIKNWDELKNQIILTGKLIEL